MIIAEVGDGSLLACAERGDLAGLREAIKGGADLEARDLENSKMTALMWAALAGFRRCVKALIKAGAEVDARDEEGWCALSYACREGHAGCVEELVAAGCLVDSAHADGATPLLLAAMNANKECLSALIAEGGDFEASDARGRFALAQACADSEGLGCVEVLLAAGCDLEREIRREDSRGHAGATSLTVCAYHGRERILGRLIASGARVDHRSSTGQTALMVAARQGKGKCVEMLLAAGADAWALCEEGMAASDYAEQGGDGFCRAIFKSLQERRELMAASVEVGKAGPKRL